MNNISFDAASFSEQLGIYDFFNILVSGAIFIFGLSAINTKVAAVLWDNIDIPKGIGLVLLIYVVGLVLQEIGSIADKKVFKIYKGMNRRILAGKYLSDTGDGPANEIIDNPLVLKRYREYADELLDGLVDSKDETRFNNAFVNGVVFSACQYSVSISGKDRKAEKLRALFGMSRSLMVCFALLAVAVLFLYFPTEKICICGCDKIILCALFSVLSVLFYWRTKKNMRHFLLILLGTYDALRRSNTP